MLYTVKIEQTDKYPKRMKYIAETDSFIKGLRQLIICERCASAIRLA